MQARAGREHWVQVSARSGEKGEDFRLVAEPSAAPAWLRIVQTVRDGDMRADGRYAHLRHLGDVAMDDEGRHLFVDSQDSLHRFARDAATGLVEPAWEVPHPDRNDAEGVPAYTLPQDSLLHWSAGNDTLYDFAQGSATAYRNFDGEADDVEVCRVDLGEDRPDPGDAMPVRVLTDPSGGFLYLFTDTRAPDESAVSVFSIDAPCSLGFVQALSPTVADDGIDLAGLADAVLATDGAHIYAVSDNAVLAFARAADSGELTPASSVELEAAAENPLSFFDFPSATSVTMDAPGRHLFAIGAGGTPHATVFDVATKPATPELLASTDTVDDPFALLFPLPSHVLPPHALFDCRAIGQHRSVAAVDAACVGGMFVTRWDAAAERLFVSDYFGTLQPDRFGTDLPEGSTPRGVQSPDGRHLYVVWQGYIGALTTLERVESMTDAGN